MIVWDENDYSGISTKPDGLFPPQNQNRVVLTVQTNHDEGPGIQRASPIFGGGPFLLLQARLSQHLQELPLRPHVD